MAKITEKKSVELSVADAVSLVKNANGRVRFQVRIQAYLPCGEGKVFDGITFLSISRTDMVDTIKGICSETLERRGAKVRLGLTPAERPDGLSFICLD